MREPVWRSNDKNSEIPQAFYIQELDMPLVSMRQLLDHAAENGYGLPAFNVNNLEQVQAIMQAADEVNAR
jgi:hypothetical protein